MSSEATICVTIRRDETYSIKEDPAFGRRLAEAIESYMLSRQKQHVQIRQWNGIAAWVVGADAASTQQVYVLQEGTGERVSATEGSKAAVDALVDVLRSRGYRCMKTSTAG